MFCHFCHPGYTSALSCSETWRSDHTSRLTQQLQHQDDIKEAAMGLRGQTGTLSERRQLLLTELTEDYSLPNVSTICLTDRCCCKAALNEPRKDLNVICTDGDLEECKERWLGWAWQVLPFSVACSRRLSKNVNFPTFAEKEDTNFDSLSFLYLLVDGFLQRLIRADQSRH